MVDHEFESGNRDPHEDRLTWLILLVVAALMLAGVVAHRILFGTS